MSSKDNFKQEDVHDLKNPAYVVREGEPGGCVVEWNEEFRILTNFRPSDIDDKYCHQLMCGVQECEKGLQELCKPNCPVRGKEQPSVCRDLWINSKDQAGKDIKKKVDIYIFPFHEENVKYALHILFDKNHTHSYVYFWKRFERRFKKQFPQTMDIFREHFSSSYEYMEKAGLLKEFEKEVFHSITIVQFFAW